MKILISRKVLVLMFGVIILSLSGCAPIAVFGAVGATGMVMSDRRTNAAMLQDQEIELKIGSLIRQLPREYNYHIDEVSFNGVVLLAGEVGDRNAGIRLEEETRQIPGVTKVYNELVIAPPSSLNERASDTLITTKVKSDMAFVPGSPDFYAGNIKVVTERGIVYLMGLLRPEEMQPSIDIARKVSGVVEVVPLFETYNAPISESRKDKK